MKRIAVTQSNYIPWKGYFDLIAAVDEFVIYDAVQYTRRDWRNRNRIKTPQGPQWLTVPVIVEDIATQTIDATRLADPHWATHHWRTLSSNYRRAPHFDAVRAWLEPLYHVRYETLSDLNAALVKAISRHLRIGTAISDCRAYALPPGKSARLISICCEAGADVYVTGPAAKAYLDVAAFAAAGVAVEWFEYPDYPEYPQRWPPFVHQVSILDLLFNCGDDARRYIKPRP